MKHSFGMTKKQQAEAIKRLQILKLDTSLFQKNGEICICSSSARFPRPLTVKEWRMVQDFESSCRVLVYLIVRTNTTLGLMDSLLYIDSDEHEWVMARSDLMAGYTASYTVNHTYPELSEFGSIGVRPVAYGGVIRTF